MAKKSGKDKPEAKWVNIAQVCRSQEGRLYIKANNYKGRLIWQQYGGEDGDNKESSEFYLINTAGIFDPHKKAPDFVQDSIAINLMNEKSVELLKED